MATYKVTVMMTVDEKCKRRNDSPKVEDLEYVRQELGWLESSFSGVEWNEIEETEEIEKTEQSQQKDLGKQKQS